MHFIYKIGDTLQIFRKGTTSNDKIEADKKRPIVQTYTFSRQQFELVREGFKGMKLFFNAADTNCLDCPYNTFGRCYTHKFNQFVGFKAMLKMVVRKYGSWDVIPVYSPVQLPFIAAMCKDTYIRFGTYGEPSLIPVELIEACIGQAASYTGYTHQWKRFNLGAYFMASVHDDKGVQAAKAAGYRSFVATNDEIKDAVHCPASKEQGFKSHCSKCALCSGTAGKGTKSVYIYNH